jgi:hypothetical protein
MPKTGLVYCLKLDIIYLGISLSGIAIDMVMTMHFITSKELFGGI